MYPDMSQHQSHQGLHGDRKNSDLIEPGKSLRESLRRLKSGMCLSFTYCYVSILRILRAMCLSFTSCSLLIFIFMVEILFWNASMQESQTSQLLCLHKSGINSGKILFSGESVL